MSNTWTAQDMQLSCFFSIVSGFLVGLSYHTILFTLTKRKNAGTPQGRGSYRVLTKERKKEVFQKGQEVAVQNNLTKWWDIWGVIMSCHCHYGLATNSHIIKSKKYWNIHYM